MKHTHQLLLLLLPVFAVGGGSYTFWKRSCDPPTQAAVRKVLFYQDSMHPWIKSDRPGKCTICAMDLTPIHEGQTGFGGENVVAITSNQVTVLSVQTEPAKRLSLSRALRVAGTLEANEARKTVISAPARGRIDGLAVDYAGVEVQEGQKLITLFSPELVQLRRTLLAVRDMSQPGNTNVLTKALVDAGIYTGEILAPQSGVVLERNVYSGQYVAEGDRLLTIADASVLWFRFDVYQDQLPWFGLGQPLQVEVSGIPGKVFPAVITFVEPTLNETTRTVKVRADIRNPIVEVNGHKQRLLKFGMYAEARARAEATNVLAIARTSILFPGGSAYAYVAKDGGAYERRRLKLGRQGDEFWEVLAGIEEGESVVTSGNTLIDAQAQFNQGDPSDFQDANAVAAGETEDGQPGAGEIIHPPASNPPTGTIGAHPMTASSEPLHAAQHKALTEFLAVADGISRALAADSLDQLKQQTGQLPSVVSNLMKELGDDHPWHPLIRHLEAFAHWPSPADLAAARKSFLPFSTNVVELVQLLRGQEQMFSSLKVYHCPMAPKPGLWFQANGPRAIPTMARRC